MNPQKHILCTTCFINILFFGSTEALEFAQTKLTPFGKMDKFVDKLEVCYQFFLHSYCTYSCSLFYIGIQCCLLLQDFLALLAYEEPEKSPMFHLLSPDHQQQVAESLNRAILGLLNESSCKLICSISIYNVL